jgi:Zn-dependent protease with chaperone function
MFTKLVSRALSTLLVLSAVILPAQLGWGKADDDDDFNKPTVPTAALTLHYDNGGKVTVYFSVDREIENWAPIQAAMSEALHCAPGALTHPAAPRTDYLNHYMNAEQQTRAVQYAERVRRRHLHGSCAGAMTRQGLMLITDIPLKGIVQELRRADEQELVVSLTYPSSRYAEHTPATESSRGADYSFPEYRLGLSGNVPAAIHLAFGFRSKDVYRVIILPIVFLLLPLIIVLWMRRAALRGAEDDPTAAWFSYFRTLNWCTLGILLLWNFGHSIRSGLEELAAYHWVGHEVTRQLATLAILILPPWIVYLLCLFSSYRVYVLVRGDTWKRGEFYANQVLQVATLLLPITCLLAGTQMLTVNRRISMACFAAVYFVFMICARLRLKVSGTSPEALTTGELRDRVFDLAKRAAVEIRQLLVMPAGKMQMANAFASRSRMVIFTDYLLNRLDKREVAAVAAHEITHIQKKHVAWNTAGWIGLMLLPWFMRLSLAFVIGFAAVPLGLIGAARVSAFLLRIPQWPELDLFAYSVGLVLFYFQSRHLENAADAGAVRLTGDPEAVMTALLKIGRLNLMPIRWSRISGSLLTHPSTLRRVERIARVGHVPPERVQQILSQYRELEASQVRDPIAAPEEHFVDAQIPARRVLTTARSTQSALNRLWILIFFHIAPPALLAWSIERWRLPRMSYVVGAVLCLLFYGLAARWLGVLGWGRLQREFASKLKSEGIVVPVRCVFLAGFSPHDSPRFYVSATHWDTGFVFLGHQGVSYAGDQVRFTLRPGQVRNVRLGPGVPSWFPVPRVYVDWWDENQGTVCTFNLLPMIPSLPWRLKKQSLKLYGALRNWVQRPNNYSELAPALASLGAPQVGEVTSRSLKSLFNSGQFFKTTFWIVMLAIAISIALSIPNTWYVCGIVLLLRGYEFVPYWRYKEDPGATQVSVAAKATAGS